MFFFDDERIPFAGLLPNLDGSSDEWETFSMLVPYWTKGRETQIKFWVADWGQDTDPTVYIRNISSASVPKPSIMLMLGVEMIRLVGIGRKKLKK